MFQCTFNISSAARKAAFENNGQIWADTFTLKIQEGDLTPEQRAMFADIAGVPANEGHAVRANVWAEGRDLSDLIAAIEKEATRKAAQKQKEADDKAARLQQAREAAQTYIAGGSPSLYHGYTVYPTTGDAELDAAVLAEKTKREAEIKAKEKAREEITAQLWDGMALWGTKLGSTHIRRLIEGGYNWKEKCVKEWCEAHTPEGWADISQNPEFAEWWQIKNPSETALDAMDAARAEFPGIEISLYRVKFKDEYGEKYLADYLSMTIAPPIGDGYSVEKFIADYEVAE